MKEGWLILTSLDIKKEVHLGKQYNEENWWEKVDWFNFLSC
jgi:hypothetical protein